VRLTGNVKRDVLTCVEALAPMRRHAIAIILGTTAFTLFQPIDAALCSQIGNGCMATMAYAQRVLVALGTAVSLGAYAIAARTSHSALERGGRAALRRQSNREVTRIAIIGGAGWLMYELLGRYALGRILGSSEMGESDIVRLVTTLQWMLLGLGPMAALPYLFRVFYSLGEYKAAAMLGATIPPIYGGIGWLFLRSEGILALATAYAIVWWIGLLVSLLWLNRSSAAVDRRLAKA
jgi:peptidoglycan biosynthesis protein MviN/MurJ (putative lipid II flippase)